jgi:cytochrome P450
MTERESWGVLYAFSVSAIATATTIALAAGLCVDGGLWGRMADAADAARAVEEAVRYGSPFPHSSRFAREPFTAGDLAVEPGEQVLMWLTAANRGLPGEHRRPLDEFDPWRDVSTHVGWGSGYHRCGGVHHGRAVATTALRTLAELVPGLAVAGPWERFAGIDDGFVAAPAHATRKGHAVHSTESATR